MGTGAHTHTAVVSGCIEEQELVDIMYVGSCLSGVMLYNMCFVHLRAACVICRRGRMTLPYYIWDNRLKINGFTLPPYGEMVINAGHHHVLYITTCGAIRKM